MAQKYTIGEIVKFKNKYDGYTYIGEIIDYTEHNNLYEIDIHESIDNLDNSLPETGASYEDTIYD